MEALYHQTNHMLQEIERLFQGISSTNKIHNNPDENIQIENEIQMKITAVNSNCDRLDVLLFKVPATQRSSAKMRVDQLRYDMRHLQRSLQLLREKRQRRQAELSEREQLLSHRFNANNNSNSSSHAAETCLNMDYALQHNTQLGNAHQGVDDMLYTGHNVLDSLKNQRETLKSARTRIINIGSTLGLSNHTMKLIERRLADDKWVLLGGMFVTLTVIALFVYYYVF